MLDFYRALIALRKAQPDLHADAFDTVGVEFDELCWRILEQTLQGGTQA